MMQRIRRYAALPALLALALVGVWVGVGLVHSHSGSPTCQVCNALQFSAADLVAPPTLSTPTVVTLEFTPSAGRSAPSPVHLAPQGRAPPTA